MAVFHHHKGLGRFKQYGTFGSNFGNSDPVLVFDTLGNGSVVPTVGTPGTFTRSTAFLVPTSKNTLASVAIDVPSDGAFAIGPSAVTHTVGGYYTTAALTNYLQRASEFDNATWVKTGTASVVADSTTDPLGTSTADTIVGALLLDSVDQDSGFAAIGGGGERIDVIFSVWLRADSGSRTVNLICKDETAVTPESATEVCTVTTSWQQFRVRKRFSATPTGTIHAEIQVNDTTGYSIYAFGAGLWSVADGTLQTLTPSLRIDWDMLPTLITAGATAQLGISSMTYEGTEFNTLSNKHSVGIWFYVPEFDSGNLYSNKNIFATQQVAVAKYIKAIFKASGGVIALSYHSATGTFLDTTVNIDTIAARWNYLMIVADGSGGSTSYLNGVSIHTDSSTWVPYTVTSLHLGQDSLTAPAFTEQWNSLIGRTQFYIGAANEEYQLGLYNAQKSGYGL